MIFILIGGLVAIVICIGMIAFGAGNPPPLASMNDPLEKVDFSDLPALQTIPSDTASPIVFREWKTPLSKGEPELTLILIHGSSGSSTSLHPLGNALSAEGIFVYAPDIRGHGNTGRKGDILPTAARR